MLEEKHKTLKKFLDEMKIDAPVSRQHYLQRCWPVITKILNSCEIITVIDAGCGDAYESILFAALGAHVTGIELREDRFKLAVDNVEKFRSTFPDMNISLINRDVFATLRSMKADVVWVRQAISHIHPAEKFIEIAADCLNSNGLLVINDSNGTNPLVAAETVLEHWKHAKTLNWFVTDQYKDPVTKQTVPYAVERLLTTHALKRMLQNARFKEIGVDFTGYVPVSVATKLPQFAHGLEALLKEIPVLSMIGREYTVVGKKN
jgi:SAM-dependent methyltransferase